MLNRGGLSDLRREAGGMNVWSPLPVSCRVWNEKKKKKQTFNGNILYSRKKTKSPLLRKPGCGVEANVYNGSGNFCPLTVNRGIASI